MRRGNQMCLDVAENNVTQSPDPKDLSATDISPAFAASSMYEQTSEVPETPAQGISATPETHLVADEDDAIPNEVDSAFGDEISSYSTSLRSSVLNYRYENGRRYHGYRDGAYMGPNDETEQSRLDLMHHIFRMMLNGALYLAPIPQDIQRILDIGTGTGLWAMEVADELPSAIVIGTDLSPIQPPWIPANCRFYVDDAETEWMFEHKFQFIHGRALCGAIADWPKFYAEVFKNLEPGGWLEMQEHESWVKSDDGTVKDAVWTNEWNEELDRASLAFGKRWNVAEEHVKWIRDAGFEEVREIIHKVPIGPWAKDPRLKEMGRYQLVNMTEAVNSFTPATFTRILGYSLERMEILMAGVKREFANYRKLHLYVAYHFVLGRKPMTVS